MKFIEWKCNNAKCKDPICSGNYVLCGECKVLYATGTNSIGNKRKLFEMVDKTNNACGDTEHEPPCKSRNINLKVYCLCEKPFDDTMIGCDYCDDGWYHPECLDMDSNKENKARNTNKWRCPPCELNSKS